MNYHVLNAATINNFGLDLLQDNRSHEVTHSVESSIPDVGAECTMNRPAGIGRSVLHYAASSFPSSTPVAAYMTRVLGSPTS
jgi:hypothetical protein